MTALGALTTRFLAAAFRMTVHSDATSLLRYRPLPGMASAVRLFVRQPPERGRSPAIFLDRDGVINERIVGGYVRRWEEFHFIDGAEQALRQIRRLGVPILVISNQAGVGKGLASRHSLEEITTRFVQALARAGARIDAAYYCPHVNQDNCPCRKPRPGLLLQAARDWRLDLSRSVMVGDSLRDLEAAYAAGCRAVLFDSLENVRRAEISDRRGSAAGLVANRLRDLPGLLADLIGRRSLMC
jgi:D-glycero-D-manno-heptose 1,7-bisphosphate phosphatase